MSDHQHSEMVTRSPRPKIEVKSINITVGHFQNRGTKMYIYLYDVAFI